MNYQPRRKLPNLGTQVNGHKRQITKYLNLEVCVTDESNKHISILIEVNIQVALKFGSYWIP